eukprot:COSAG02_NODE_71054_length_192_cov_120.817204_1_plen_49_part_01
MLNSQSARYPEAVPYRTPKSVATGEAYEGVGSSDISYQPGKAPLAKFNL